MKLVKGNNVNVLHIHPKWFNYDRLQTPVWSDNDEQPTTMK